MLFALTSTIAVENKKTTKSRFSNLYNQRFTSVGGEKRIDHGRTDLTLAGPTHQIIG